MPSSMLFMHEDRCIIKHALIHASKHFYTAMQEWMHISTNICICEFKCMCIYVSASKEIQNNLLITYMYLYRY